MQSFVDENELEKYFNDLEVWEQKMMAENRWAELYVLSSEARKKRIPFPEEIASIVKRKLNHFEQLKEVYEDLQKILR